MFYCPRRRPRSSAGEDLGAEGGGQVQTQDRLQGEADGGDLSDVTRRDCRRGMYKVIGPVARKIKVEGREREGGLVSPVL